MPLAAFHPAVAQWFERSFSQPTPAHAAAWPAIIAVVPVVSIFVNPLQFGANEDFGAYPRDLDRDSTIATGAGVDVLFTPSVDEMYPGGTPMATFSLSASRMPLAETASA